MLRIEVQKLKHHVLRVLDQIKGRMVVKPVAVVAPLATGPAESLLQRLVAEGRAKPPATTGPLPTPPVTGDLTQSVADVIAAMRDDERS